MGQVQTRCGPPVAVICRPPTHYTTSKPQRLYSLRVLGRLAIVATKLKNRSSIGDRRYVISPQRGEFDPPNFHMFPSAGRPTT